MNEPIFSVLTGKESAPLLLATFPNKRVVDSGPNNYWLSGSSYNDDRIGTSQYGDFDPEVDSGVSGKYSTYALKTGDNTPYGGSGGRDLNVGVNGPAGVGAAHLNAQLISSSFTMEAWIKPTVALADKNPNNYYYFSEKYFRVGPWTLMGVSAYDQWQNPLWDPETNTGPVCTVLATASGSPIANANSLTVLTANAWNHVAFVRDVGANQLRVYLNGALIITAADDPNWALSASWQNMTAVFSWYFNERMYFDQLRIMPGAVYSGATITPPAAGFSYTRTPAAATTELLLNATHGLEDWGARAGQIMARQDAVPSGFEYSPAVSVAAAKWGAGSYRFGYEQSGTWYHGNSMRLRGAGPEWWFAQSGDYISTLLAVLNNGPWTIEAWVRPTASISYSASPESYASTDGETYLALSFWDSVITVYDNTISVPGVGSSQGTPVAISAGTTLEFFHSVYDPNTYEYVKTSYRVTAPTSLARNQWHHIAVVADVANNLLRLKVNGAEVGTIDISQTWSNKGTAFSGDFLYFGGTYDFFQNYPALGFKGYMDDIRVSSAALYGTGSYSVPTGPLT